MRAKRLNINLIVLEKLKLNETIKNLAGYPTQRNDS